MSYAGWGNTNPAVPGYPSSNSSLPLGGSVGYGTGWGNAVSLQRQQQQDEALFNSLHPVGGVVTGDQVKPVFQASGLSSQWLAQIWGNVDLDRDGKINRAQFCSAMDMLRKAKQTAGGGGGGGGGGGAVLLNSSLPASFSGFPSSSLHTRGSNISATSSFSSPATAAAASGNMQNKSWSTTIPGSPSTSSLGGVGHKSQAGSSVTSSLGGVGHKSQGQGWSITPQEMRRYVLEFNALDVAKTGFISGADIRSTFTLSGLEKNILVKIWDLSDVDKDGRLSCDEYAIAMHLLTRVKGGASLPSHLPPGLYPGSTKYTTVDRAVSKAGKQLPLEKKNSVSDQIGGQSPISPGKGHSRNLSGGGGGSSGGSGHTRNPSGGAENVTFEDKRKENFEAGRLELERRRRAIKEQQEKIAAEKERRKREEEERRLQQERQAEAARQAELECQRRKAMEIEEERERQMKRLALQREEEQKEEERKKKAEWAKKRRGELEGQRDWERKSLYSLRIQHSQLEDQLRQCDQRKMTLLASSQRQTEMSSQISLDMKTMQLSHDVRRAELTKLHSELNGYHTQLSSLQRQRRELRESLQGQSPEMTLYQQQRQALKDRIIGLAASLAGLRSNLAHNSTTMEEVKEANKSNSQLLKDLTVNHQSDSAKIDRLREQVLSRQRAFEEEERVRHEEARRREEEERRREEEERREREVAEKTRREVEERVRKESRLEKIKRDQENAMKKARLENAMAEAGYAKPHSPKSPVKSLPHSSKKPPLPYKPPHLTPSPSPEPQEPATDKASWTQEDDEITKKVKELQRRKLELQKERQQSKANPVKPVPYVVAKGKEQHKVVGKGKPLRQEVVEKELKGRQKGKKDKKGEAESTPHRDEQLLDLNSSWDSTAPTKPAISSFAQDTSQILTPLKPLEEEEEEERGERKGEGIKKKASAPPLPKPRSTSVTPEPMFLPQLSSPTAARYSVPQLSQLFDSGIDPSTVSGWSSEIQQQLPSPNEAQTNSAVSTEHKPAFSYMEEVGVANTPSSPREGEVTCMVIYGFQASEDSEVTIGEGDTVTFVPRNDASPGWVMVRKEGGASGWVPESYLETVTKEGSEEVGVASEEGATENATTGGGAEDDVARETGQVMPTDTTSPVSSSEGVSPLGVQAEVLYTWKGSKDNHLNLNKGEVVSLLQQSEKWWSGECNGAVGWFPKTFVKILEAPPTPAQAAPTEENVGDSGAELLYDAIYEYVGETEEDLSFQIGDVIKVTSSDGDWWTGEFNGINGTFPSNYVQVKSQPDQPLPPSPSKSLVSRQDSATPISPSPSQSSDGILAKPLIARVLVNYQSTKKGQLSLAAGELVKVYKQAGNGWWEGELQSRGKKRAVGWFPANRVELLPQKKPSSSSSTSILSNPPAPPSSEGSRVARARSPLLDALEEPKSGSANLVLALYTYTAQTSDELSFHKGSVITVLGKEGEWWKGEINEKIGLFPSNYVQPLTEQQPSSEPTRWADSVSAAVLESVSDKERKRQEAIFEVLTSERHYVDSLRVVKEVFFDPMAAEQVLTEEEMAKVMVNWDELIQCSSDLLSSFLVRLRTSGEVVRGIGDVLALQIPNLTPHIRWCGCQLNACLLLQQKSSDPKFKEFEQKCSTDPRTGGLPLSSFLLKPMQRVTKYPLLVKRILDYTSPLDSDYMDLKSALERATTLCEHVNDGVMQKENTEQLEWLQSHVAFTNLEEKIVFNSQTNFMGPRKLLHHGKFFKIRGSKDLVGFLFNDFLLLVRPKLFFPLAASPADLEPWGKNEFQLYRKPYLLDGLRAKKGGPDNTSVGGAMLSLLQPSSEDKDILLRVDGEQPRDMWIKKITKASLDFITTKKKMEREKKEKFLETLRGSVGTLEVKVVEGRDLLAKDPNGKSDPFCVVRFGDQQQEQNTPVIHASLNPKWNYTMQFAVHDLNKDSMDITVFDKDLFSPNDFLGCGCVSLKDLLQSNKDSPWDKTVLLENVASGEVTLKITLTLNKSNLLL